MQKNHELAAGTQALPPSVRKTINEEWHDLKELLNATEELCQWLDEIRLSPWVRKSKDRVRTATEQVRGDS